MHTQHRNGVFIPSELDNFPAFLHRLGRIHSLFTVPHPLSKVDTQFLEYEEDEEYNKNISENAITTMNSFHTKFFDYLVKNRFYGLVYHYLDSYR